MKRWAEIIGVELSVVSWKEKCISALGGWISILLLLFITSRCLEIGQAAAIVASMGASAVLLFAVPHGQLSQPWPVLAGHGFSALIGVSCAKWIADPVLAAGCAVGLAIGAMHVFKCIHPPGGATALTAVLGGPAIQGLGYDFVWCPVLLNGVVMIGVALAFNGFFSWRRYPVSLVRHRKDAEAPSHDEIVTALRELDSFIDISEEDLSRLSAVLGRLPSQSGRRISRRKPLKAVQ